MVNKIMFFLAGIASIWLGLRIFVTGGHRIYGYPSEYANLKIPVGVFFIICGGAFFIFSL